MTAEADQHPGSLVRPLLAATLTALLVALVIYLVVPVSTPTAHATSATPTTGSTGTPQAPTGTVHKVIIRRSNGQLELLPAHIDITVGDSVQWHNRTTRACHLEADMGELPHVPSLTVPAHGSLTITFDKEGLYSYRCAGGAYGTIGVETF